MGILSEFYRFDDWYRNIGISIIGVLTASEFNFLLASVSVAQIILLHAFLFSSNDYYDYIFWKEKNYIGNLIQEDFSKLVAICLIVFPLVLSLSMFIISGYATVLIFLAATFAYLYQGPPRLKKHWLSSILINSLTLGWVTYAYPFLVLSSSTNSLFWFFSALFISYISFFEIVHQLEHQNLETEVKSVLDSFGLKNVIYLSILLLTAPTIIGIFLLLLVDLHFSIVVNSLFFCCLRTSKLLAKDYDLEDYKDIRNSWHKYYVAFECSIYLALIILI